MEHCVNKTDVETFVFLWLTGCVCRKALWLQFENYPVSLQAKPVSLVYFVYIHQMPQRNADALEASWVRFPPQGGLLSSSSDLNLNVLMRGPRSLT